MATRPSGRAPPQGLASGLLPTLSVLLVLPQGSSSASSWVLTPVLSSIFPPSKVRSSPGSSGLKRLYLQGLRNLHLQGLLPQGCRSVPATFATTPQVHDQSLHQPAHLRRPAAAISGPGDSLVPGTQTKACSVPESLSSHTAPTSPQPQALHPQNAADP